MSEPDRLLVACQKGNLPQIIHLIEQEGISVNHANGIQQSALHIASWWARTDCIAYLLSKGASHSATNTVTGATPLHCVLQSSKAAVDAAERLASLRTLLQHGADPQALDFGKRTPLEYVDKTDPDKETIVALFQEFIQPTPAIFQAIQHKSVEEIKRILVENNSSGGGGSACQAHEFEGQTPLLRLVSDWCDLEKDQDEEEYEFIKEAIHVLLDSTASMAAVDDRGNHHHPVQWLYATMAQDHGSSVQVTAMDLLCQGILDRYKMTIAAIAYNDDEEEEEDHAEEYHQYHHGGDGDREDFDDVQLNDWCAVVDKLVALATTGSSGTQGPPPCTDATQSLWHEVARRNWCDIASRLFIQWKVSFDVTNRQGMTPLQFAARSGHVAMIERLWEMDPLLVQRQLQHEDHRKTTPLQAAQVNGHTAVVAVLHEKRNHIPPNPTSAM